MPDMDDFHEFMIISGGSGDPNGGGGSSGGGGGGCGCLIAVVVGVSLIGGILGAIFN